MSIDDLVSWAEVALYDVGRRLRSKDELLLDEARQTAEALVVVLAEIQRR